MSTGRAGQAIIADKNYYGRDFEATLGGSGFCLLGPARHGEPARPCARFLRPLRQVIESVNATFQGQPDLERHDGHHPRRASTRIPNRVQALTTHDLAQPPHRPAREALPSRLRPPTPWNRSSSG